MVKGEHSDNDVEALSKILSLMQNFSDEVKVRFLKSAASFFNIAYDKKIANEEEQLDEDERDLEPKTFLFNKKPKNDTEKIACLGYFLATYREKPQFSTKDLTKLNTEAASHEFTNTSQTVKHAVKMGYFAKTSKSTHKQMSIHGEQFVKALPNREEADLAMKGVKKHKRSKKNKNKGKEKKKEK